MIEEIARMRVEERIREGAEVRRSRSARNRRGGLRRALGTRLVRAGNALLAGARVKIA